MLAGLTVTALILRAWVLVASGRFGADEAIPGLMARHIVSAHELPAFYWGQAYFGAAESYAIAALFLAFGFHPWLVFVPAVAASVALVPLVWALGEHVGPWPAGLIAALPIAIPPPVLSRMLTNAGGGFSLGFALECGAILCLVRAYCVPSCRTRWVALLSLLTGFAGWVWQPALAALPPLLGVLLAREPALRRPWRLAGLVALAVVGLAPMLAYNIRSDWPTLSALVAKYSESQLPATDHPAAELRQFGALLLTALGGGEETFGGANPAQGLLLATALLVQPVAVTFLARRSSAALWQPRAVATGLVLIAAVLNTLAAHAGARYLVPASLAGYVLMGGMLALPSDRLRGGRLLGLGLGVLAIGVGNLRAYADISGLMAPEQVSRVDEAQLALATLEQRGLATGYADYWTAYPITYLSGEAVVVAPVLPFTWGARTDRYPAYTRQVDAVTEPSRLFVLVDRHCASTPYLDALDAAGATYRVDEVARWLLVWDIHAPAGAGSTALASLRQAIAAQQTCQARP